MTQSQVHYNNKNPLHLPAQLAGRPTKVPSSSVVIALHTTLGSSLLVVNLGHQHDLIWNHWALLQRRILTSAFEPGRLTLSVGSTCLWKPQKRTWKMETMKFAYPPSLHLPRSSILLLQCSVVNIRRSFFRLLTWMEDHQLSRNSPRSQHQGGVAERSGLWISAIRFLVVPDVRQPLLYFPNYIP